MFSCQHLLDHRKSENPRKTSTSVSLTLLKPLTVWITTNCGKFLKRWEYQTTWPFPENYLCRSKATVRTRYGTMDWFKIGKGVCQGSILSPCLFNLYAEYIMWNTGLEEHKLESWAPKWLQMVTAVMKLKDASSKELMLLNQITLILFDIIYMNYANNEKTQDSFWIQN